MSADSDFLGTKKQKNKKKLFLCQTDHRKTGTQDSTSNCIDMFQVCEEAGTEAGMNPDRYEHDTPLPLLSDSPTTVGPMSCF